MTKVTLNDVGSLIDATTAANTINANSATIETAFDNTLSRDGTQPNTMNANLDMNSNRILNLPEPENGSEPLRLLDVTLLNGGGTLPVEAMPIGGTVGQVLTKNSSANYDSGWQTPSFQLSTGQVTGTNIASNTVTNANLAQAFPATIKGNPTAITSNEQDFTIAGLADIVAPNVTNDYLMIQDSVSGTLKKINTNTISAALTAGVSSIDGKLGTFTTGNGLDTNVNLIQLSAARRTLPTMQKFLTAASGTYVTPANCIFLKVRMVGAGGGGAGSGNPNGVAGNAGTNTTFNSIAAKGGSGGFTNGATAPGSGGAGGTAGTGTATLRITGNDGGNGYNIGSITTSVGGSGGGGVFGSGAQGSTIAGLSTTNVPGTGGAGAGSNNNTSISGGGGGGGGEYVELFILNPVSTYSYTVGTQGGAGTSGSGGLAGGHGSDGCIIVEEYYNS